MIGLLRAPLLAILWAWTHAKCLHIYVTRQKNQLDNAALCINKITRVAMCGTPYQGTRCFCQRSLRRQVDKRSVSAIFCTVRHIKKITLPTQTFWLCGPTDRNKLKRSKRRWKSLNWFDSKTDFKDGAFACHLTIHTSLTKFIKVNHMFWTHKKAD